MPEQQADGLTGQAGESGPALTPSQKRFYASEQCGEARAALKQMVENPDFETDAEYFRSNARAFVERHLHYLSTHPTTNVAGYLSNLRLMTRASRR